MEDAVPDNGACRSGFTQQQTLDWHWDQPCWPKSRVVSAHVAGGLTVYRCVQCGAEYTNPFVAAIHRDASHAGRPSAMTVYPPAVGVEPKGEG